MPNAPIDLSPNLLAAGKSAKPMINGTSCSRMNYNQGIISGELVFLMGAHVEPLHALSLL
jgi:hypothetical protein